MGTEKILVVDERCRITLGTKVVAPGESFHDHLPTARRMEIMKISDSEKTYTFTVAIRMDEDEWTEEYGIQSKDVANDLRDWVQSTLHSATSVPFKPLDVKILKTKNDRPLRPDTLSTDTLDMAQGFRDWYIQLAKNLLKSVSHPKYGTSGITLELDYAERDAYRVWLSGASQPVWVPLPEWQKGVSKVNDATPLWFFQRAAYGSTDPLMVNTMKRVCAVIERERERLQK